MDTRTIFLVGGAVSLFVIISIVTLVWWHHAISKPNASVLATITEIRVEASSVSNWWVVTAHWTNPQTGQTLIFRSRHLHFRPRQHIGEQITVTLNTTHPQHYRMNL